MSKKPDDFEDKFYQLRSEMEMCSSSLSKDIAFLHETLNTPEWIKTTAVALIFAVFGQTVIAVWWASQISSGQAAMSSQVKENTQFRIEWRETHGQTLAALQRLDINVNYLKNEVSKVVDKQSSHFKDINQIYNEE